MRESVHWWRADVFEAFMRTVGAEDEVEGKPAEAVKGE